MTYHHARHSQQNTKNNSDHNGSLAGSQARLLRLLLLGLLGQFLGVLLGEQRFDKLLNLEKILALLSRFVFSSGSLHTLAHCELIAK